ncbi:OmpH family outer membrane protein [Flavobacterium sp. GT3R68]|uniref:OmpH family outer membrane protein n=1 Tax=Flavobacterium sp. GT3R68 TaxID=2594437 RepID=UPI0013156578|nr:OmpH family outer membrane protein [Flavobacterium sp. GT3R68]
MLKNKLYLVVVVNSILICLLIAIFVFNILGSNKIVYVDNIKLFDGFNMTKEMKRVGEKEFNARKSVLDTLYFKLQSPAISETDKKVMMQQFIQGKEELEQFNQNFGGEETSKIWARIHSYSEEFSKTNNYDLVIGSENKRSVLFADGDVDVTNELLTYINKKYEGLK